MHFGESDFCAAASMRSSRPSLIDERGCHLVKRVVVCWLSCERAGRTRWCVRVRVPARGKCDAPGRGEERRKVVCT